MSQYRHGALYVVEDPRSRGEIAEQLRRVDDRLFLERQIGFDGVPVWCVVCQVGGDVPPITILEWRDSNGEPIHDLSSGIVGRVERMERNGKRLADSVIARNKELVERKQQERREQYREITVEHLRSMDEKRSVLLPRGQHLRRSRDRMRAQGRKV